MLFAVSPWNSPLCLLIYLLPWKNTFWQLCNGEHILSATTTAYPTISPSIFCFFLEGHLDLQPSIAFSFLWLFLFLSICFYPYLFQGPRLDFWEPLFLYLNYLSAKIKLFGQTSFSILQLKIETWHDPVWTVESSTKFVIRSSIFEVLHTPLISWKYGIFVVAKQSIFGFSIINHEIWNLLL